jgi:ATP-dependent Zn protease
LLLLFWQVHARNKSVDPTINWQEVARAMSGFTGALCVVLFQGSVSLD